MSLSRNPLLYQVLNSDKSILHLDSARIAESAKDDREQASVNSSQRAMLDKDRVTNLKANIMITQLEGSKITTDKSTLAKTNVNYSGQQMAKQMQAHILLLNTGESIDLTKSNLINRSVPRGVNQFTEHHQQLIKRTLNASNTENQSNFDLQSQLSAKSLYLRSGSVEIRKHAREEASNLTSLSRAAIQRKNNRRFYEANKIIPTLRQEINNNFQAAVSNLQFDTLDNQILVDHLQQSEKKNLQVSSLGNEMVEDKKLEIKKILRRMQRTAVLNSLGEEDPMQQSQLSRATLLGHAARQVATQQLELDDLLDQDPQVEVLVRQVSEVAKSDLEKEYEKAKLAEKARLDERRRLKQIKEVEKLEMQRIRKANLPVLTRDEMEAEIQKYYMQQDQLLSEQEHQEERKRESQIWKGQLQVKTKFTEEEDNSIVRRDSLIKFAASATTATFKRKVVAAPEDVQSATQQMKQVIDGPKDKNFWKIQALQYQPIAPEPSERSETHYSMNSANSFLSAPLKHHVKPAVAKMITLSTSPRSSATKFEPVQEEFEEKGQEDVEPVEGDAGEEDLDVQSYIQEVDHDEKHKLIRMKQDQKKQQHKYQLEMCGQEFLVKIQELLDSYNPDPQFGPDNGNNELMLNSGFSSQYEMEASKNRDTDVTQKVLEDFSQVLKQQAAFFNKCKVALLPKFNEHPDENVSFYRLCEQEHVLVFPVFSKILNQSLLVKNQKLHTGKCIAMKGVLTLMPNMLTKIYLDSNGLQGSDLSIILEGLQSQVSLKTITIQNNEIDDSCVKNLGKFLERRMPFNLSELNIYHCRIGWKQTSDLLERIKMRNQLTKLSLVKANINEISIQHLEKILRSKSLVNLDISWNSLTPRAFKGFLETLSTNRRLQYINLAWNNLSDVQATPEEQKVTLHSLGQMIKHNKNLLHMDITSAGLGSFIIREIGTCLRRARSILSIHLSGNPGLSTENFDYLVKRIRCRPNEDIARFVKIENVIAEMTKDFPAQYHQSIHAKMKRDSEFVPTDFQPMGNVTDKIIFQRILGFKEKMPGTGQWYESSNANIPLKKHYKNNCWLCEGHVYSVIFWSRGRAYRLNPIFKNREAEPIRWEIDKISQEDKDDPGLGHVNGVLSYDELEDRIPYLAGSFTGWRYKKMIPLHELTKAIDKDYVSPLDLCKYEGQIRKKISDIELLEPREQAHLQVASVLEDQRYRKEWPKYFKNLPFKQPYLINGTYFENLDDEIDVLDEGDASNLMNDLSSSDEDSPEPAIKQVKKKLSKQELQTLAEENVVKDEPMPVPPDNSKWDVIYVLPIFVQPGKHTYLVKFKNTNEVYQKKLLNRKMQLEKARDGTLDMTRRKNRRIRWNNFKYEDIKRLIQPDTYVYKCQVYQRTEPVPICK